MALTANRPTPQRTGDLRDAYLLTNRTAYAGGLCVTDTASGYDKPAVTGTGLVAKGVFMSYADSTGIASGTVKVPVATGIFRFDNSAAADAITIAWRGQPCFIVDDTTVAKTDGSATRSVAGTVVDVDSAGVWVDIGSVNGTSLAAEVAAREALVVTLASTANGDGASLIGVEDSGGKFTATTVEAALAEGIDARRVATTADANTIGGVVVCHRIAVADGATGNVDVTLNATYGKLIVTDVHLYKTAGAGGASDTIQVFNGSDAITDAMSINVADTTVVRAGQINDANNVISAGGTLRVTRTKVSAANVACVVIVTGLRSA